MAERLLSGRKCDPAERVRPGPKSFCRLFDIGEEIRLSLLDEVDGGSVFPERDDLGACLDLDALIGAASLLELRFEADEPGPGISEDRLLSTARGPALEAGEATR